ncbi:Ger(x)C family spore germination protein [Salinibacillus xinjiangensis]|nr:Ger(x)C family spore germination protein [Salinibacillus xinjiangensis]
MQKKIKSICVIIILTVLLSGCWDARELSDIAIATALGVDKEGDQILVSAQILNPGEIAGNTISTRTAVSTYQAKGSTFFEAIRKLTTIAPRRIYLAHLRMIILGEEFARGGVADVLDFISRDHEMRTDFNFAIARENTAENVVQVLTPLEKIPANKIFGNLQAAEESWAGVSAVKLDELIASMTSKGKEASVTGLWVIGDPEFGTQLENVEASLSPTEIKTDFIGVFKNDRFVDWLNEEQSKTLNRIKNKVKNTISWVPCDDGGKVAIEVFKTHANVSGSMKKGIPKINVDVKSEANVGDVACALNLTKPKELRKLESKFEKSIEEEMKTSIKKIQEMGTDVFGFGEVIHRASPKEWKKVKGQWNEIFANELEVKVNVKIKIRRTGTINQSFLKEIEEKRKQGE